MTAGEEVLAVELDSLAVADGEPADTGFCSISSPRAATSSVDLPSDKHEELQTMGSFIFFDLNGFWLAELDFTRFLLYRSKISRTLYKISNVCISIVQFVRLIFYRRLFILLQPKAYSF